MYANGTATGSLLSLALTYFEPFSSLTASESTFRLQLDDPSISYSFLNQFNHFKLSDCYLLSIF